LKNERAGKLFWLLPLRLLLDGIAALQFAASGQVKNIIAIIKAHWSFFLNFGMWLRKRKDVSALITERNTRGVYKRSIIVQYFLKGKKKFTQLSKNDFK